ncbi:MAG: PIN domain-containing protein [Gammaproteobacteria bacterium]|nr:PIN domain-containing protein [Gammaproteobacteria bacterium]
MIVLVDTDVLIDVALGRAGFTESAGALLDALEQRSATGYVAWHTISNFYYLVRPNRGRNDTKQFVLELLSFMDVAPTSTDALRYAANLEMSDFEDAMQVAAAIGCHADFIATRNIPDYARSPIKAALPSDVVAMLG